MRRFCMIYSGLNLNQDKAMKPQTVQIVRQGEATPYWFKFNSLYYLPPLFLSIATQRYADCMTLSAAFVTFE